MMNFDGIYEFSLQNNYKFAIVVYHNDEIVHICMYPERITMYDLEDLKEELKHDELFGLQYHNDLKFELTKIIPSDDPEEWEKFPIKSILN